MGSYNRKPVTGILMLIRKPTLKDKESLARLYIQFWKAHPGRDPLLRLRKKPTMRRMVEWAVKDIKKRNQWMFVAEEKGRIIGFIELLVKKNHKVFRIRKYGYINSVVVDRKFRKRGVGKLLVRKAIQFFRQRKIMYARTNVYFSNRTAMSVWPKMGFKQESLFMIKRIG